MPLTHVGMYQARIAAADIAGQDRADYTAIPRVIFLDPEIAAVGLISTQAAERGIDLATAEIELPEAIARRRTYEREPRGTLGLLADRDRCVLVGAWAILRLARDQGTDPDLDPDRHGRPVPHLHRGYLKGLEQLDLS